MMSETVSVKFQNTKGQRVTDRFSAVANFRAKDSDERDQFTSDVSEGDYVAVVYQTPSNGGSLHRCMGTVTEATRVGGQFSDLRFSVERCDSDGAADSAYFHLNPETGDYYFTDGDSELPADGWRVEKVAWTPEGGDA